jgi:hypothetical protein
MHAFSIFESLEVRRFLSAAPLAGHDGPGTVASAAVVAPLTTGPKPTEGGETLTETAGQRFTAKLGEFTYKTVDQILKAVINWGDGTKSEGKLVGSYATGEYYVQGTHTYTHPGTFKVDVKVFGKPAGSPITPTSPLAQFTSVINVKPGTPRPSRGGRMLTEVAGRKFTDRLGEIEFRAVDQLLNAVIDWGDGTHSDGKLVGSYATGEYYILGTHTYAHAGTYKVDVTVYARIAGNPNIPASPVESFTSVIKVLGSA